jgi:hypothetical protein
MIPGSYRPPQPAAPPPVLPVPSVQGAPTSSPVPGGQGVGWLQQLLGGQGGQGGQVPDWLRQFGQQRKKRWVLNNHRYTLNPDWQRQSTIPTPTGGWDALAAQGSGLGWLTGRLRDAGGTPNV